MKLEFYDSCVEFYIILDCCKLYQLSKLGEDFTEIQLEHVHEPCSRDGKISRDTFGTDVF